jgi:hypothetical protein
VSGEKCIVCRDLAVSGEANIPADVAGRDGVMGGENFPSVPLAAEVRNPVDGRFFLRSVRWRSLLKCYCEFAQRP